MTRAMVIKTYGDPEMCDAIVDGMTQSIVPVDTAELEEARAECERLRTKPALRSYGDSVRLERDCQALADKYRPVEHGRLYWGVVVVWACMWLVLTDWRRILDELYGRG